MTERLKTCEFWTGPGGAVKNPPMNGPSENTATGKGMPAQSTGESRAARTVPATASALDVLMLAGVGAVALTIAGYVLADYLRNSDLLWRGIYHDRNGHFNFGVDLALAIRNLDPIQFFSDLEKARVWPPLHGLVLSAVLLVGGIDHRLGIVPSLAGWVLTIVFVWLVARRLFCDRVAGSFAAAVAVTLTAASPAFRLIAGDVMLEGLGAGLSAMALWAYMRASPEPENAPRWRLLGLVLTALFFEKGNYWGLVAAPIALGLALENAGQSIGRTRAAIRRIDAAAIAVRALRDPLLILAVISAVAFAWLLQAGPTSIVVFGRNVSLYPPQNLLTVTYALLFARACLIWRANRGAFDAALGVRGQMLFYWHVVPVAISFLIPKRLYVFLWYIGPTHYAPMQTHSLPDTVALYWNAFIDGFHVAPSVGLLAVALAAFGATQLHRFPRSARVVFLMAVVGAMAVVLHPQHQGRFLTSWIFSMWIAAGLGAGAALQWLLAERSNWLRAAVAVAAVAALAAANMLQKPSAAAYVHAIHPTVRRLGSRTGSALPCGLEQRTRHWHCHHVWLQPAVQLGHQGALRVPGENRIDADRTDIFGGRGARTDAPASFAQ